MTFAVCPTNPVSWCKYEAVVNSMGSITVATEQAPSPPLVVLSLSLKITVNPRTGTNEVGVVYWKSRCGYLRCLAIYWVKGQHESVRLAWLIDAASSVVGDMMMVCPGPMHGPVVI